jgi:integrase
MGTKMGTKYHASSLVQLPAKGNKWYIVVTKPKELQTAGSIKVRRSTGTIDPKIAKGLQLKLTQEIYSEFDEALKPIPPTLAEIAAKYWKPSAGSYIQTFEEMLADSEGGDALGALKVYHASGGDKAVAEQLFDCLDYDEACAFRNLITPEQDPYPVSSPKSKYYTGKLTVDGAPTTANSKNFPLASLMDLYVSERKWAREKSKAAAERHLEMFQEITKIKDIGEIQKRHAYRFAEGLQAKGYANKTIKSAVSSVRSFLTECEKKELVTQNPFVDLKLANYGATPISYKPFTRTQLAAIFSQKMKPNDKLCLSILISTGMRLDEVSLLDYEQVKQHEDGFFYFDLTQALVKNEGSLRYVPLHSSIKLTLKSSGRIFDYAIGKDGKAESDASKKLMKIIRKVTDDQRLVIHSMRGTFKDMLREIGVHKEINDFITGHGHGDVAGNYGDGPSIRARYDAISKLDLNFITSPTAPT